jgi:hypothetical protein
LNEKKMATGQSRHPKRKSNVILTRIGSEGAGLKNMDEKPSAYVCKNCETKIIYHPHAETKRSESVPAVSCPVCSAVVPELGRVKVIAFFRKSKSKAV